MIVSTNFASLSIKESPAPTRQPRQPTEKNFSFTKKIRLPKGKRITVNRILSLRRCDTLSTFKITNISVDETLIVNVAISKTKKEKTKEDISIIESLSIKEINKKEYKPETKIKCNQYLQISYLNTRATGIIEISGSYKRLT